MTQHDSEPERRPDNDPFATSEQATPEAVAARAGGQSTAPAQQPSGSASSGNGESHHADSSPFATSEQASDADVADRAAQSPSRLNEGDR